MLLLHAGAGEPPTPAVVAALHRAAESGAAALHATGPLDAVIAAVTALEAGEECNAGRSSTCARHGECELDAAVVDGAAQRCAGVAALRDTVHPVQVAHRLLESGGGTLLAGDGAHRFARAEGFTPANLRTEHRRDQWRRHCQGEPVPVGDGVGCLAADTAVGGGIAVATSGGGRTGRPAGQVGDAAVPGAGLYADPDIAVLCAGAGQFAVAATLAVRTALRCRERDVAAAAEWAVGTVTAAGGTAGVLVYDRPAGALAVLHSAEHFPVLVDTGRGGRLLTTAPNRLQLCRR